MLAEKKTATNIGVGVGIGLEFVAVALVMSGRPLLSLLALPVGLASIVFFAWGCWSYAAGKGYPSVLGLLGVFFGLLGLLILVLLPDKCKDGRPPVALPAYQPAPYPAQPMASTHGTNTAPSSPAFAGAGTGVPVGGFAAAGVAGSGNGNGAAAATRPPMGGDGAAGWDEGSNQFVVPRSALAPQAAAARPSVAAQPVAAAAGDVLSAEPKSYSDRFTQTMRPPTPPANHWSVQQPA